MRNFAIRPTSTSLLAVHAKHGLLSRLTLAALLAFGTVHAHDAHAADAKSSIAPKQTLQQAIRGQLHYTVTDDKALLQAWYGSRNFTPLWVTENGLTTRGKDAINALSQVANEGLPPARYDLSALTTATTTRTPASQAELEVAISIAVQTYLHDLRHGAANPHAPAFGVEGLNLVEKHNLAKAIADARPANPRYGQLSQQLKQDRAAKSDKMKVRETILSLEQLRWEQQERKPGARFAKLETTVSQ